MATTSDLRWALTVDLAELGASTKGAPTVVVAQAVLAQLALHADADGTNAYPAVGTIADLLHLDRRTVQRALRWLRDVGLIRPTGSSPSGTTVWALAVPARAPRGRHGAAPGGGTGGGTAGGMVPPNHCVTTGTTAGVGARERTPAAEPEGGEPPDHSHTPEQRASNLQGIAAVRAHLASRLCSNATQGPTDADHR